jgi:hypothetical protein
MAAGKRDAAKRFLQALRSRVVFDACVCKDLQNGAAEEDQGEAGGVDGGSAAQPGRDGACGVARTWLGHDIVHFPSNMAHYVH